MKKDAVTKSKFKQLKRRLRLVHWQVVGILESLWRSTEASAPAGDIGRLTDEEIAADIEWEGDASDLVAALVESRWLDRDDEFRLIVHDWSIHCPNHLKGGFARQGLKFADQIVAERSLYNQAAAKLPSLAPQPSTPPKLPPLAPQPPNPTQPYLTKPIQSSIPKPLPDPKDVDGRMDGFSWAEVMTRLVSVGVVNARQACDEARIACGCSADWAMKLIDYAVANKKGPGAIVWRFKRSVPSMAIENGWPENGDDPNSAVVNAEKNAAKQRAAMAEVAANMIIKGGRKAKKSDDDIKAELAAAGLEWPK